MNRHKDVPFGSIRERQRQGGRKGGRMAEIRAEGWRRKEENEFA